MEDWCQGISQRKLLHLLILRRSVVPFFPRLKTAQIPLSHNHRGTGAVEIADCVEAEPRFCSQLYPPRLSRLKSTSWQTRCCCDHQNTAQKEFFSSGGGRRHKEIFFRPSGYTTRSKKEIFQYGADFHSHMHARASIF